MKRELERKIQVVATVTSSDDIQWLRENPNPVTDILEFRIDNLWETRESAFEIIPTLEIPVLATIRRAEEGGQNNLSDPTRLEGYHDLLSRVPMIDTEIATLESPLFGSLVEETLDSSATLIASFHDFDGFPGTDTLKERLDTAYEKGADVGKVAVVTESIDQVFDLVALIDYYRDQNLLLSAMGMGRFGKLSRLVLAEAGSCLNYGYLQESNAPGQWAAEELSNLLVSLRSSE